MSFGWDYDGGDESDVYDLLYDGGEPNPYDLLYDDVDSRTALDPYELLECDGAVLTEKELLKAELRHEREAKGSAFAHCQRLEQETVQLKSREEADKREIERLKGQIASMSMSTGSEANCAHDLGHGPRGVAAIINNIHFEDMADRDGAEGDTDVSRYFHYIKENVITEWRDLADRLGLSWADITNIDGRNKDDKSRCWDALQEWRNREGEAATIAVLMEALGELGLKSVVDGLRSKYPGSRLARLCSQ